MIGWSEDEQGHVSNRAITFEITIPRFEGGEHDDVVSFPGSFT